ncbi:MAG: hypothetical protein HC882_01875 [Acidobacteria bacterium]|nr:hypothetical protein [Acidobacteriota bacterium]
MTIRFDPSHPGAQALLDALGTVFPDPRAVVTHEAAPKVLEAVARVLPEEVQKSVFGDVLDVAGEAIGADPLPEDRYQADEPGLGGVVDYWIAKARHTRFGVHTFVGRVPMVRVRLAEDHGRDLRTKIGVVYAGDHKLWTQEMVERKYADVLEGEVSRVELLTPARWLGARFGAVSIYRLFSAEHGFPHGYAFEAGMATGEAMTLYFSPGEKPIQDRRSWYEPTPFSSNTDRYSGSVDWDITGPRGATVKVSPRGGREDHQTVIDFELVENPAPEFPAMLTAEAAARVVWIADKMGGEKKARVQAQVGILWEPLLAWAKTMEWE